MTRPRTVGDALKERSGPLVEALKAWLGPDATYVSVDFTGAHIVIDVDSVEKLLAAVEASEGRL